MKRLPEIHEESAQDSFLDVIANLVGVIIILVMLVGSRAAREVQTSNEMPSSESVSSNLAEEASPQHDQKEDLTRARNEAMAARAELERIATHLVNIRDEAAEVDSNRVTLAMHRKVIEEDIDRRRGQLDTDKQREFDVQRQIAESQIKLDQLTKQQMGLLSAPETTETLECMPTPIARELDADPIYMRVKGGLVSIIPVTELMREAGTRSEAIRRRLQDQGEASELLGPLDGYRIRLNVVRQREETAVTGPRAGHLEKYSTLLRFTVFPNSDALGQEVNAALAPGGTVHDYLQVHRRETSAAIVFLYDDSFQHSRTIKRRLWELGFTVGTEPKQENELISFVMGPSATGRVLTTQ